MAKKVASFRLETDVLDWVGSYSKTRGTSQAVVVEQALMHFRELSKGGVPDLPVVDTPEVRQERAKVAYVVPPDAGRSEWAKNMSARQRALNEAKTRASR